MKKLCLDCDWEVRSADGIGQDERSRRALEHFTRTGHHIETLPEVSHLEDLP